MRRANTALVGMAAVGALLTGCGTDGGGNPTTASAPGQLTSAQEPSSGASPGEAPATETAAGDPTNGVPAFPEGTARQHAKNSGEWDLVLADVRVGEHESFDRIVLEFTGTGTPGWTVNYVDEAVLDGSGEVVTLGGDAILDIYASGSTYPGPEGDYYSGPRQFEPDNGGDVRDVHVAGTFEGSTQVLVGIEGDRVPFRVFALTDPSRLVVDAVNRAD